MIKQVLVPVGGFQLSLVCDSLKRRFGRSLIREIREKLEESIQIRATVKTPSDTRTLIVTKGTIKKSIQRQKTFCKIIAQKVPHWSHQLAAEIQGQEKNMLSGSKFHSRLERCVTNAPFDVLVNTMFAVRELFFQKTDGILQLLSS